MLGSRRSETMWQNTDTNLKKHNKQVPHRGVSQEISMMYNHFGKEINR